MWDFLEEYGLIPFTVLYGPMLLFLFSINYPPLMYVVLGLFSLLVVVALLEVTIDIFFGGKDPYDKYW